MSLCMRCEKVPSTHSIGNNNYCEKCFDVLTEIKQLIKESKKLDNELWEEHKGDNMPTGNENMICKIMEINGDETVCYVEVGGWVLPKVGFRNFVFIGKNMKVGDWFSYNQEMEVVPITDPYSQGIDDKELEILFKQHCEAQKLDGAVWPEYKGD